MLLQWKNNIFDPRAQKVKKDRMESYQLQVEQKQRKQRENRGEEKVQFRDAVNISKHKLDWVHIKNKVDE